MSKMGGKDFEINKFSWTLRKQLFIEHLGLDMNSEADDNLVNDPVESGFYNNVWLSTCAPLPLAVVSASLTSLRSARKNTDVYESVFPSIPRDSVFTYEDYVNRQTLPADATKAVRLFSLQSALYSFPLYC